MKRNKDPETWTVEEIETAAIVEMLHTLVFFRRRRENGGAFPKKEDSD